ncbi:snurportin-1 isoform X2 [Adelges cooleyi]|uniref:snurportin-1 isoform X2 n=1 Tax=Adelges cooleyi TaxID=133065 RepID=UPI002180958D|nr:snurportin-1 isoform X2 [Adelges cooleyi]
MGSSVLKSVMEIIDNLNSVVFIKRDEEITKRRNIDNNESTVDMEVESKKSWPYTPNSEAYELATSMMYSEWLLEVPENIDDWIAVLCPEGKRCCVIAQDNKTKAVNKKGTSINFFPSLFPYGCHKPSNSPSHRKRTVLDCIYNFKLKKYFVLDVIEWMGVPYTNFDAEFRFYFIQSKLAELPGIDQKSVKNNYPFELAPRMLAKDCYPLLLEKSEFFTDGIQLDGINFYYPESLYTPGDTPLVLWLKPFMIPEILQKPVNDQLLQLPYNYVNIFEYIQSPEKKIKKFRKKRTSCNSDKMDVDNLVEVEVQKELTSEQGMSVEN